MNFIILDLGDNCVSFEYERIASLFCYKLEWVFLSHKEEDLFIWLKLLSILKLGVLDAEKKLIAVIIIITKFNKSKFIW